MGESRSDQRPARPRRPLEPIHANRGDHDTWSFGNPAAIEAVGLHDVDQDGQLELLLPENVNWEDVPGATGGYGYVHRYAD
ncbi:MAG: hypothetical protein PVF54_03740, partial [Anaerolineae bacterium]